MWQPFHGLEFNDKTGGLEIGDSTDIGSKLTELRPNLLDVEGSESLLTNERSLINKLCYFSEKFSRSFSDRLREIIDDYRKNDGVMSERIRNFFEEKDLFEPSLRVLIGEKAGEFLNKNNLKADFVIGKDVILVFQLPKPLAKFWWKGDIGGSMAGVNREIKGVGVEWGKFYHDIMPLVWEFVGEMQCESDVYIERINNLGQHHPDEYYYVWKISKNY